MPHRLTGRVALVTGGTSGIGAATVELFVAEGASVVFTGRAEEAGREIAARLGENATFFRADVMREEEIAASVDHTVSTYGRLDILFNNAGGPSFAGIETVTREEFHHAMDLLLGSVVFGIKHAAPRMRAQHFGRIINNSSVAAAQTDYGGYLYSAAKAAVNQVTRMAGMELARHGITVNSISPGGIATPIFYGGSDVARGLDPEHDAAKLRKLTENLAKATPLRRAGLPEDVAHAALYLAAEGGYVNCHDLVVDAGMSAGGRSDYGR
jgi:NAD(P)-dependent dehydrogenase (short-subunit alcohol dehydrogenase family)